MTLTPEQRDGLRALAEAASESIPGVWEATHGAPTMGGGTWTLRSAGRAGIRLSAVEYQHGPDIAAHIAAFDPPTTLALLDALTTAEAARDAAERQVQAVRELHKRGEVMAWQEDCTNPEGHDCMDDPHGGGMLCTDEIVGHYCHGCAPEDAADVDEYPWPCPTIRALNAAGEAGR